MTENEFGRYISLYRTSARYAALCITGNAADAEDIVQDVFLKLYLHKGSFDGDEHVRAWLLRCTVNMSIDFVRSYRYRNSVSLSEVGEMAASEPEGERLLPTIMRLGPKFGSTLYLRFYEGYSVEETAKILRISSAAVKWRTKQARAKLKRIIDEEREQ